MEARAPSPGVDPFEWLGRGILTDQLNFAAQYSTNGVTGSNHDSAENFAEGDNNVTNLHVSNPIQCDEILVEDVFSVDENQLDISDVPESDASYVAEELFPSAASHKFCGVPSTIHEEEFTGAASYTDTGSRPSQHRLDSADFDTTTDSNHTREKDQTVLLNRCDAVDDSKKTCLEGSDGSNGSKFHFEAPSVPDASSCVQTSTASDCQYQQRSLDEDFLQLSTNETEMRCPSTGKLDQTPIQQLNSDTAPSFTGSLFELPPENIGEQYTAPLEDAFFGATAGGTHRFHSDTGLPFSGPLFEVPLENTEYQQTTPTLTDTATTDDMNFGTDLAGPSAAATITTATSTNIEDDLESALSDILFQKEVAKDCVKRRLEENYALFNDDDFILNLREDYGVKDQVGPIDRPDEFVTTKSNKGRRRSSCSRDNRSDTSSDSDDENIISPGMVGYTGFDEDEENMCNKEVRKRASYEKLGGNSITEAKPKTKKIMFVSVILVVALVTAVSVILSLVIKKTPEAFSSANDASGIETNESVDNVANTATRPTDDTEIHPTLSSHVQADSSTEDSESTAPSMHPNQPTTSSAPSLSLIETALTISTVNPSSAPEVSSAAPTVKPTTTNVYPTSTPSESDTSNRPSTEYNYITTESTRMQTTVPTSVSTSLMPSSVPTSVPSVFNVSIASSLTSPICNGSEIPATITNSVSFGSGDQPCATFFVDFCKDDPSNLATWAIVQLLTIDEFSPSPTPHFDDYLNYDDDQHYDDDWNYDDVLFDDFSANHSTVNNKQNQQRISPYMSNQEGLYFSDQNFTITGNNSVGVCLPKGTYNFILTESSNQFALYFGNGRPIRPMSIGNYSEEMIDITAFEVTTFDVLGTGTNSTQTPVPIFAANASSNSDENSTGLITSSGDDLVHDIGKAYGILFDVETGENSLIISSIELYLDTSFPAHYEVHTKDGSWKQDEVSTGFREISHGAIVGGGVCQDIKNCTFARIPNEDFDPIVLARGSRQSFYVTSTTDDLVFQHFVKDGAVGINFADVVQASSPELTVYQGAAVLAYPLELADPTTDFRPGGFIGRLVYEVLDAENVSLQDNFVPDASEPSSQTDDECYYYTEESCRNAAKELGLSLGGSGFPFSGHFGQAGCYFYPCSNCMFGGHAYFGKSVDKLAMESTQTFHAERRLDCTTNVDNLSKDTSFWCLFPSSICNL